MKEEKLTFDVFFLSRKSNANDSPQQQSTVHFGDDQRRGCSDGDLDDVVRHGRGDWRNRTLQIWVFNPRSTPTLRISASRPNRVVVQPVGRFESVFFNDGIDAKLAKSEITKQLKGTLSACYVSGPGAMGVETAIPKAGIGRNAVDPQCKVGDVMYSAKTTMKMDAYPYAAERVGAGETVAVAIDGRLGRRCAPLC